MPALTPEIDAFEAKLRTELARRDLLSFIMHVREDYQANWHHEDICAALMEWASGEGPERLMLFMPASNGKSEIVSRCLPAWLLGRQACNIIACSHTQTLANEMSTDVREIMRSEPYQFLFGNRLLQTGAVEAWRTVDGGKYHCAGVGGPVTGKHFHFGIIDDPIKNAEEAFSETMREKTWQWYTRVFRTRRIGGNARMLLTTTRWHEDDLAGRIMKHEPGKWRVLSYPAIDESDQRRGPGGALWPARYPLSMLLEEKALNHYAFESLYQQRPVPEGGGMFKRQWFKYAEKNGSPDLFNVAGEWRNIQNARRYITADLAASSKTSADFTVLCLWASFRDGKLVLLDVIRGQYEWPDLMPIFARAHQRLGGDVWVEQIGAQKGLVDNLRRHGVPARPLHPDKDKVTRAAPAAAAMQGGQIWFAPGEWNEPMEAELMAFDAGEHDDQVDAVAYGVKIHNMLLATGATQVR